MSLVLDAGALVETQKAQKNTESTKKKGQRGRGTKGQRKRSDLSLCPFVPLPLCPSLSGSCFAARPSPGGEGPVPSFRLIGTAVLTDQSRRSPSLRRRYCPNRSSGQSPDRRFRPAQTL
jgi:hypothetical protein